jgi:hypothetical protein
MIATIAIFLFIMWLLGVFGVYSIGWIYHALLIISIMLIFVTAMRGRKPEITEIMGNCELSEVEAEQVKGIMDKNKLDEKEAMELLCIRSKRIVVDDHDLIQTKTEQIKKVMNKNKLNKQEAVGLLSLRLKFHH